ANPAKATCSQFTDLFVALCRAAGIPCREVVGFAQTDNPQLKEISQKIDLLHTWPEYFNADKNTWIAVDPTFGNTTGGLDYFNKFDMNHFAFVIHGESDSLPTPPGSFINDNSKKIFVSFGEERPKPKGPSFALEQISPPLIYTLKQNKIVLQLRNNFGGALYREKITNLNPSSSPKNWSFERILPYSLFKIEMTIKPEEIMKDYSKTLVFSYNETGNGKDEIHYNIKVLSLLLRITFVFIVVFSAIILGLFLAVKKSKNKVPYKK
ncbi:MAG: transglutaminase domain-containing protein, partial [Microgenomates group bacterium]